MIEDRSIPGKPVAGRIAALVVGASLLAALVAWLAARGVPYMNDFIAYWSVGRLLLDGANPYDTAAILELQRILGSQFVDPGVVRNPPWTLPLLLPFASLPFATGWYAWIVAQLALVGGSAAALWRLFGGRARPAVAIGIAFGFPPALFVALGGQIGGFLLLGLAGFTWAIVGRRDFVAGLFLAILTLKPHLLLPFGIIVLLWTAKQRRPGALIGAAAGVAAGSLVVLLLQPEIFRQYLEFAAVQVPDEDVVSTPGAALRLALGFDRFWVQWIPAVVGSTWAAVHYIRNSAGWDWSRQLPLVGAVSWLSAPYGWVYDMVILVPAVLDGAARIESARDRRLARRAFAAFLLIGVAVWAQQLGAGSGVAHAWVGFAILGLWLAVARRTDGSGPDPGPA